MLSSLSFDVYPFDGQAGGWSVSQFGQPGHLQPDAVTMVPCDPKAKPGNGLNHSRWFCRWEPAPPMQDEQAFLEALVRRLANGRVQGVLPRDRNSGDGFRT